MHTGIVSPRSAISRKCSAPVLWRCQCIATVRLSSFCTRYMPTLRMPRTGSLLTTAESVMYGPPSSGQQVITGMRSRSISSPRQTTSWQAGDPLFTRGGNFVTSRSRGSSPSFAMNPSGTFRFISSVMRAPCSSRFFTPSASAMRVMDPNRLIATGNAERWPLSRITCSNSSAGPPPGNLLVRSAISHNSSLARTGCVTRTSSPMPSIAAMKSCRESRDTFNRSRRNWATVVAVAPRSRDTNMNRGDAE